VEILEGLRALKREMLLKPDTIHQLFGGAVYFALSALPKLA
jgi:hypothetical protein